MYKADFYTKGPKCSCWTFQRFQVAGILHTPVEMRKDDTRGVDRTFHKGFMQHG